MPERGGYLPFLAQEPQITTQKFGELSPPITPAVSGGRLRPRRMIVPGWLRRGRTGEGAQHGLEVVVERQQQGTRRAARGAPPLLPIADCADGHTNASGESGLR